MKWGNSYENHRRILKTWLFLKKERQFSSTDQNIFLKRRQRYYKRAIITLYCSSLLPCYCWFTGLIVNSMQRLCLTHPNIHKYSILANILWRKEINIPSIHRYSSFKKYLCISQVHFKYYTAPPLPPSQTYRNDHPSHYTVVVPN